MRILFLGDVVGSSGCSKLVQNLPSQKKQREIDFVMNPSTNTPFPSDTGNAPCEVIMEWIAPN